MMYSIIYRPAVKKDLKRLDRPVLLALHSAHLPLLKENPYIGERLKGEYRLYKYKFTCQGVSYRIVYDIKSKELVIVLILIGTRENFYKELKRRVKPRRARGISALLFLALLSASLAFS